MKTTVHVAVSPDEITITKSNALADSLTASAWLIARTALWNGKKMEAPDQEEAQHYIHDFISRNRNHAKNYEELVIRLLAERFHRIQLGNRKILSPATWFHHPVHGFRGTEAYGHLILNRRRTEENYKGHWMDLAWAVWYSLPATPVLFHKWRTHFAETSQPMLNLYLACMQNSKCKNQPPFLRSN